MFVVWPLGLLRLGLMDLLELVELLELLELLRLQLLRFCVFFELLRLELLRLCAFLELLRLELLRFCACLERLRLELLRLRTGWGSLGRLRQRWPLCNRNGCFCVCRQRNGLLDLYVFATVVVTTDKQR